MFHWCELGLDGDEHGEEGLVFVAHPDVQPPVYTPVTGVMLVTQQHRRLVHAEGSLDLQTEYVENLRYNKIDSI